MKLKKNQRLKIKGFDNPDMREALRVVFNECVKSRTQQIPMNYEQLTGYLNAMGDIYLDLTDDPQKDFKFDKEILELLEDLKLGRKIVI